MGVTTCLFPSLHLCFSPCHVMREWRCSAIRTMGQLAVYGDRVAGHNNICFRYHSRTDFFIPDIAVLTSVRFAITIISIAIIINIIIAVVMRVIIDVAMVIVVITIIIIIMIVVTYRCGRWRPFFIPSLQNHRTS